MSWQRVGDDVVLHLAWRLIAGLHSVDGLAGGALEAAVLIAIVVHGNQALEVVLVSTLSQAAHRLSPRYAPHARAFVAWWSSQGLHADGAVLRSNHNTCSLQKNLIHCEVFHCGVLVWGVISSREWQALTSSGGLRTFWRYLLTTSSGVLPARNRKYCQFKVQLSQEGYALHGNRTHTFAGLFLGGLPAAVAQTRHRLDVTLADRWRVKHQLRRSGQAHRKSCCAHQNPCDAWKQRNRGGFDRCTKANHWIKQVNINWLFNMLQHLIATDEFGVRTFTSQCWVHRARPIQVLHRNCWHTERQHDSTPVFIRNSLTHFLDQVHSEQTYWVTCQTGLFVCVNRLRSFWPSHARKQGCSLIVLTQYWMPGIRMHMSPDETLHMTTQSVLV